MKIKIDGVELPAPVSIDYNYEDLDVESDRDTRNGILSRNVLRSNMLKISITYGIEDAETISNVIQAITPNTFNVEVFDVSTNSRKTKTMYAGSKSMQMIMNNGVWIKCLKFNLVEV